MTTNAKQPIEIDETVTEIGTETITQPAVGEERTVETQIDHGTIAIETADETIVNATTSETETEKENENETVNRESHIESPRVLATESTSAESHTKVDHRNHVPLLNTVMALDVHREEIMDMGVEVATAFQEAEMDMVDVGVIEGTRSISINISMSIGMSMSMNVNESIDTRVTTRTGTKIKVERRLEIPRHRLRMQMQMN